MRLRRATEDYTNEQSEENIFKLVEAAARVEQWMHAHTDSKAIGVVEGYAWWLRKMRIPPLNKGSILGRARKLDDGRCRVTVAAYSSRGKFDAVQFSDDGKNWSPEQPYAIEHEFRGSAPDPVVYARLIVKDVQGREPTDPIKLPIARR